LFEVVGALGPGGGLADLLDGRQQEADEHGDDRDDHQQLDQGKPDRPPALGYSSHDRRLPCNRPGAAGRRMKNGGATDPQSVQTPSPGDDEDRRVGPAAEWGSGSGGPPVSEPRGRDRGAGSRMTEL